MTFVKDFIRNLLVLCAIIAAICIMTAIVIGIGAYLTIGLTGMSVGNAAGGSLALMILVMALLITLEK